MNKLYDEIYIKYSNDIYRYLITLTNDKYLSEEITQETFFQAFKSIHSFNRKCSVYTWLCAIAKNCLKKHYNRNSKYVYNFDFDNLSSKASDYPQSYDLYSALSKLKSPYKEIVQLHVFDGFSLKEISDKYHKSESFAKVAFLRAKKMLREEIKKHEL